MGVLRFSLFGSMRVVNSTGREEIKLTRTIGLLLAYLLLERHRMHPREVVAGLFWGEHSQERARNCLNTALWRLRRSLESEESVFASYLLATEGEVGFNRESEYWLDVAVFEERLPHIFKRPVNQVDPEDVAQVESALQLYRGDLLEGIYEDWVLRERERLRLLYLNGLAHLMRLYKSNQDFEKSLEVGQKILALDPLREEIHREMMQLYLSCGQRAQAARQFETCSAILQAELGISPMEETRTVFSAISCAREQLEVQKELDVSISLRQALKMLNQSEQAVNLAQAQLQHAIRTVERCLKRIDKAGRLKNI